MLTLGGGPDWGGHKFRDPSEVQYQELGLPKDEYANIWSLKMKYLNTSLSVSAVCSRWFMSEATTSVLEPIRVSGKTPAKMLGTHTATSLL